jgi:endoglycosylceramidase
MGRFRRTAVLALLLTLTALPVHADEETGAVPPLSSAGRWFTDALGRTVVLRGFNQVSKSAPYHPSAFGFGDDDAAFLAAEGFTAVRLGVVFQGLMPTPGVVETAYIDAIESTVDALAAHEIFVLLDFHQDGFAPMFNGNGLPNWMAITDGLPNPPDAVFPLYYIQNPAMQRAFEHFWANDLGPNDVPLQEYYRQGVAAVVERFKGDPWVIGYDLMNEPWPGAEFQPCVSAAGCAALEQARLVPFHDRVGAPVRELAPQQFVFHEPFVLFNFGMSPTTMPGTDAGAALSFHAYAVGVANELAVLANGVAAATRDGRPVMVTEFGATTDPVVLTRLTTQLDGQMLPWLDWAYNESIIARRFDPAGPDNLRSVDAFNALVRPYPKAVAGTPTRMAFDPTTKIFEMAYSAIAPDGVIPPRGLPTVISLPKRQYPTGYKVKVKGAKVSSRPCAELLTLVRRPTAVAVTVTVRPSTRRCR